MPPGKAPSLFAATTTVSVEKSKVELHGLLKRHGAQTVVVGEDIGRAFVLFGLRGRQFRVMLPLPTAKDALAQRRPGRQFNSTKTLEQLERTRWRALVLIIKAKLELAALGVTTVEREFLADLLLPDGATLHGAVTQAVEDAYERGVTPLFLTQGIATSGAEPAGGR